MTDYPRFSAREMARRRRLLEQAVGEAGASHVVVYGANRGRICRYPTWVIEAGMMLVVQPNVIAKDQTAGVQTGELVVVTKDGWEQLHRAPRGLGTTGEP